MGRPSPVVEADPGAGPLAVTPEITAAPDTALEVAAPPPPHSGTRRVASPSICTINSATAEERAIE
ncbi:hypothetical protein C5C47_12955 [Rathayibacter rathayi]|nr:hypothetical protein C5C47_12955 [Rathayibacter rathayi]